MFLIVALVLVAIIFFLKLRNAKTKTQNIIIEQKLLRSQMTPHFIFNSLNSVNSFIAKSDERSANKYLSDFARLMRAVMENSNYDFVPLKSEEYYYSSLEYSCSNIQDIMIKS